MPFCFLSVPTRPFFFFLNDTPTTEIYTLSLHDALPISRALSLRPTLGGARARHGSGLSLPRGRRRAVGSESPHPCRALRSEEHTSELQSHLNLVCRLLLEKKNFRSPSYLACAPRRITVG